MSTALPRVAPIVFPERWDLPGKPDPALPSIADAYRQTQFQLGPDLRLLSEGMNLQLQIVKDSSPSQHRTLPLAVMVMYWSRAFLAISDATSALCRGSYPSCPLLIRGACEAIAAERQSGGEEHELFLAWLAETLQPNEQHRANEIGMGNYYAGSTLAANDRLGAVFRAAAEFSRQHFGVTLLETASESNRQRIAATFADQTFHFGWAQLVLGWMLTLCQAQIELAIGEAPLAASENARQEASRFSERSTTAINDPNRCHIEEILEGGTRRYLVQNFRRQSTGAPLKLLL
jgi:hypothetical protein